MQNSHKTIFLDTNVFLHYRPFDQIDWLTLLDCSSISVVIPPITIRELNKQKELHPHQRVRDRAAKVLRKLNALFAEGNLGIVVPGVDAILEDREPSINFLELGLQKEVQDDNLIASILFFQQGAPNSEVVLVTSDNGLLLVAKAKRLHIRTLGLPDDHKLPEESDPHQKRVKELEEEVIRLRSLTPVLSLTFEDGNDFASFAIAGPIEKSPDFFDTHLDGLKQKYPKINKQIPLPGRNLLNQHASLLNQLAQSMQTSIADKDIDAYNVQLDQFFDSYGEFLKEELVYQNMQRRAIELKFFLANDGTMPAEDIDVRLHFPDGFTLYRRNQLPKSPMAPTPPGKPKPEFMRLLDTSILSDLTSLRAPYFPTIPQPPGNVSHLRIRKSKSFDVEFHVNRLKHNIRESIESLHVVFDSYESAGSFNVSCRILAGNIPKAVEQQLHVVIKKGSL